MEPTICSDGPRSAAAPLVCAATIVAALLRIPSVAADEGVCAPQKPARSIATDDRVPLRFGFHGPNTAIVVLGYGSLPDRAMGPELISRLRTGFVQALLAPASPIVVAGGHTAHGAIETPAMACWLVDLGIAANRVHVAPDVGNAVGAAESSAQILRAIGIRQAVLVSSADHIERFAEVLRATGIKVVGTVTPDQVPPLAWNSSPVG